MQLKDDTKCRELIKYVTDNKDKYFGLITAAAKKSNKSGQHMYRVLAGNVPYNESNCRCLRNIANLLDAHIKKADKETEAAVVELSPVLDSPMRA